MTKCVILGHRGASAVEPENTMRAFHKAVEDGADGIELDIHKTKDEKIVVIHDATIDRTSNGFGKVAEMTYADLQKFDFGNGEKIPLLEDVLKKFSRDYILNIEIKAKGLVKELLKLLNNYNCQKNCIISSFDKQPLINLKESQMKVDSALLFWKPIFYIRKTKQNLGINSLHPHYRLSTKNFLKRAKKANLKVRVWTVDNEKRIKRLIKMGIDGLITNNPLKAITYIED